VALIKSISGIRGTIGGRAGEHLTPPDIVRFTAAFGQWLKEQSDATRVVVGRDGRISGPLVSELAIQTLLSLGLDVVDLGLSTTPTVEMAVVDQRAAGGIIITASHNPQDWNALKLLNGAGEFISGEDGASVLALADGSEVVFASVDRLGSRLPDSGSMQHHIKQVCNYPLVQAGRITERRFRVVVDAVNSTGAIFIPALLQALGVLATDIIVLNGEVNGQFAHNPEPLPEHLQQLSAEVLRSNADLGIAVDPDVDRLVLVCEDGSMFGEEYTLVAVADYVLSHRSGDTVSNLSSSRALGDVTARYGGRYHAAAVGEVNVVRRMKEVGAVIGGEGNGGIIVPDLHYGRDTLIGIALILSHLASTGKSLAQLRRTYPDYYISKNRIEMPAGLDLSSVFDCLSECYAHAPQNREDGLRIEFEEGWVHLRTSNTEPIIRVIAEARSETAARHIADRFIDDIRDQLNSA